MVAAASGALVLASCGVSVRSGTDTVASGPAPAKVETGSFSGDGGPRFLRRAAQATAAVTTEKISMRVEASGPLSLALTADGKIDNAHHRSQLTTALEGEVGLGGGGDGTFSLEVVTDATTVYVKSPLLSKLGSTKKPWLKIDAARWDTSGSLGGGAQSDPAAFLDFLKGAGDKVSTVGREDVRGVSTTHVRTKLDLSKVVEQASGEKRKKLQAQLDGLGAAGQALRAVPADAWLDDDGYVRKITMSFGVPSGSGSGPAADAKASVTVETYDFNQPVDIAIPDPSEVGELDPSLLGGN